MWCIISLHDQALCDTDSTEFSSQWRSIGWNRQVASLTPYFSGSVLWDHRVSGELRMENAAVCVSVHGQAVQKLAVLLHTLVKRRVSVGNQLSHRVCGWDARMSKETLRQQTTSVMFHKSLTFRKKKGKNFLETKMFPGINFWGHSFIKHKLIRLYWEPLLSWSALFISCLSG